MTKKDYEFVARTVIDAMFESEYSSLYWQDLLDRIATGLSVRKGFDRDKFDLYCYNYTAEVREKAV